MPKTKTHRSLLKRVRITGTGKVKFNRVGKQKLNGHMTGRKLQKLRGTATASPEDAKRLEQMLGRSLRS